MIQQEISLFDHESKSRLTTQSHEEAERPGEGLCQHTNGDPHGMSQKLVIEIEGPQDQGEDGKSEEIDIAVPPHFCDSEHTESREEADWSAIKPAPGRPDRVRADSLVMEAMDLLELQIFEDPEIVVGQYFFKMEKCPKSDHQAYLMVAK